MGKRQGIWKYWNTRKLTWLGKITVIKSIFLAQLNYTISTIECDKPFVDEVQKILTNFLWNNKPPRVKFTAVINSTRKGGLGLTHFESYVKVQKARWIDRLLKNPNHIIIKLLKPFIPKIHFSDYIKCNYDPSCLPLDIPNFYRQVFFAWFELKDLDTIEQKASSLLWFNRDIKINGKMMWKSKWYEKGIKYITYYRS